MSGKRVVATLPVAGMEKPECVGECKGMSGRRVASLPVAGMEKFPEFVPAPEPQADSAIQPKHLEK